MTMTETDPFMVGLLPLTSVGFTGSRQGMNQAQWHNIYHSLAEVHPHEMHHGDCLGSDEAFHVIVTDYFPGMRRHIHPPTNTKFRAYCVGDVMYEPGDYHVRDRDIVHACQLLFATPHGPEYQRSGTWTTIRYAREVGRPIRIFWPDGSIKDENW